VLERTARRTDAKFEVVDLADHVLPHLDEQLPASAGQYAGEHTKRWGAVIERFDGLVAAELQLATVRAQVSLSLYTDYENFQVLAPQEARATELDALLDQVVRWSSALATIRAA
jgi:hypothetical protein